MNTADEVFAAVQRMDQWLDSMRGDHGYTGPISHWWESNFTFTGALFDWRYEGIIEGYRELYLRTDREMYLDKAMRAADDVINAQLPDGRFRNSSFQFGPIPGGTPHEAAVDVGLMQLAELLYKKGEVLRSKLFLDAAIKNIDRYWVGILWHGNGFWDQPNDSVLVANKHGTLLEALLLYQRLTGIDAKIYIDQCVRVILSLQVDSGPQAGGTIHAGIGPSRQAVPIYTARAMNGLLRYWTETHERNIQNAILRAFGFLSDSIKPDGVYWGMYPDGTLAVSPSMLAGAGDLLRFFILCRDLALNDAEDEIDRLTGLLLGNQSPCGGIATGVGFSRKGLRLNSSNVPDFRDVLPVVGWVDKAFRALVLCLPPGMSLRSQTLEDSNRDYSVAVTWRRRSYKFLEDENSIRLFRGEKLAYNWVKGRAHPHVCKIY